MDGTSRPARVPLRRLRAIGAHAWLRPAGLWYVPIMHQGNTNSATEEVEHIAQIVGSLLQRNVTWTNQRGETRSLTAADLLVVAPYNAQVADLTSVLDVMSGPLISSKDKKRRLGSTPRPLQARKTLHAAWSSSTAAIDSTSQRRGHEQSRLS